MKTIPISDIYSMEDTEIVFVSKDAIYIQIVEYERCNHHSKSHKYLTKIIADIFKFEYNKKLQKQRAKMTVLEIKSNFNPHIYYPKSSFVQYVPVEDEM